MIRWILSLVLLAGVFVPSSRGAATPSQVLVVVNDSHPVSVAIGNYYAGLRNIPAVNVFHLPVGTPTGETISRTDYNTKFRDVIKTYLSVTQPQLQTQIKYIVLTKYVPIRVSGTNNASLDSELTLLFSPSLPDNGQPQWLTNGYFNKNQPFASYTGTNPKYLVARLDGYDDNIDLATGIPGDIKALIDRAQNPATSGTFVLDKDPTKGGGYLVGNTWMETAATTLQSWGQNVVLDANTQFLFNQPNIIGYASWGSNDGFTAGPPYYGEVPVGSGNVYPGNWLNGAIVTDYVSTNGRTFLKAGQSYGQSLIADLIHLGASGAAGYVDEPFLQACVHPDILFARYLTGFDAIEAYYMAMPYLSWQNVVVVDPLMRSGIQVILPPSIASVFPDRGSHEGGTTVFLSGQNMGNVGDTVSVSFGGVLSPSATFLGNNSVSAVVPAHDPGKVDITITVANGSGTKTNAFLYLPGLQLSGSSSIGQNASLEIDGFIGDKWLLFLGSSPATIPAPPYGTLLLDPSQFFVSLLSGAFPTFQDRSTLTLPIPADSNLIGITAHLQAVVGDLTGSANNYFTNRQSLTIAP